MPALQLLDTVQVDTGEALLAVVGVEPIISHEVERITAPQRHAAVNILKTLRILARAVINGTHVATPPRRDMSYQSVLRDLTKPFDQEQVERMLAVVGDADVGMAFLTVSHNAFQYLQATLPVSVYQTQASAQNLAVSDPDWWAWQVRYETLDNPLSVFAAIADGSLLPSQVECLKTIYPTLGSAIDHAITDAITDAIALKRSFELPLGAEFGVATWRGDPVSAEPYQDAYVTPAETRQLQPDPGKQSPLAASSLSSAEAATYRSAGVKPGQTPG